MFCHCTSNACGKAPSVLIYCLRVCFSHSLQVGAAFGAAGQRCMAISAAVFVGGMGPYRDALIEKAKSLKVRGCKYA